jgi:hypothetical protein
MGTLEIDLAKAAEPQELCLRIDFSRRLAVCLVDPKPFIPPGWGFLLFYLYL